jgi:RNA polymerase sigma-70 factor (sigma-E family)
VDVDAEELERFCRAEYPRLVGSLTLYTGNPELAPDLAQEALARACRDWKVVVAHRSPGAWVHRVAMNLAKSSFRRRVLERRVIERLASRRRDADDADSSRALEVRSFVAGLPERQRMALVLRYWADFTVADTAEAMGCAEGTVKAHTHQAIAALRKIAIDADDEELWIDV